MNYKIKLFILAIIIIIFNGCKIYSFEYEFEALRYSIGEYYYDINNINNSLISADIPKINNYSTMYGLNYSYLPPIFKKDSKDTIFYNTLFDKLNNKLYFTGGFFWNGGLFGFIKNDQDIKIYLLSLEINYGFQLFDFVYIDLSWGLNYNWGYLNFVFYAPNSFPSFKDYMTNPDDIYEFSLKGANLGLSLGIDFLLTQKIKDYHDRILNFNSYIGVNIKFFSPMISSFGNRKVGYSSFTNTGGREIPGLETSFPFGILLQLSLKGETITKYKQ